MPSKEELTRVLVLALRYLEHPDVQAIPFARSAQSVADAIRRVITDETDELGHTDRE